MKKYIKVTERNSKDNSIIQYLLFAVEEIEYVNVCFDNLEKNKDGKAIYHMDLIMRGFTPIRLRVCTSTDRDTVEWEFNHFRKWLINEVVEYSEYGFDIYDNDCSNSIRE